MSDIELVEIRDALGEALTNLSDLPIKSVRSALDTARDGIHLWENGQQRRLCRDDMLGLRGGKYLEI